MKNAQDLNGLALDPIGNDVWRPCDNQFASPFYTSGSAHPGMFDEHRNLSLDFVTLFDGSHRMIGGDIVDEIVKVPLCRWKPFQNQARFLCLVVLRAISLRLAAHRPQTCA